MILSASRRTDIPCYYSKWFLNRLREGFLYAANPMNPTQISRIDVNENTLDAIVYWTKNPGPMLPFLPELSKYPYYIQFTLTPYGRDIEPGLPDKKETLLPLFQKLGKDLGRKRLVWRYDPIFVNERYTMDYHIRAFQQMAEALKNAVDTVIISFVDLYARAKKLMEHYHIRPCREEEMRILAQAFADIARSYDLKIQSCAEAISLEKEGICHGSCIDKARLEELTGCSLNIKEAQGQRGACRCVESIDIGAYHTCKNGCRYCYARGSEELMKKTIGQYQENSPILCRNLDPQEKILIKQVKSLKDGQMKLPF